MQYKFSLLSLILKQFFSPDQFLVVLLEVSHAYISKYIYIYISLYKNVSILGTIFYFLLVFFLHLKIYLGGFSI